MDISSCQLSAAQTQGKHILAANAKGCSFVKRMKVFRDYQYRITALVFERHHRLALYLD